MCTGEGSAFSPLRPFCPSAPRGRPRGRAPRTAALPGEPHSSAAEGDGGGAPINLGDVHRPGGTSTGLRGRPQARGDIPSQHRAQEHQKRQAERRGLRALLSVTGISGQETHAGKAACIKYIFSPMNTNQGSPRLRKLPGGGNSRKN